MGRGGARERTEFSPQAETEESGLCDDEKRALLDLSPVAAPPIAQPGQPVKGKAAAARRCSAPLTGSPGCATPKARRGIYPPEPPPFPQEWGKGRGEKGLTASSPNNSIYI